MDPLNPESFNHRTEKLSTGRIYHFVKFLELPSTKIPVAEFSLH